MSVSGSRAVAEINLDELERRLRAAGAQPPGMEDPLAELARLVESSRLAAAASPPSARAAAAPQRAEAAQPLDIGPMRPSIDEGREEPREPEAAEVATAEAADGGGFDAAEPIQAVAAPPRRSVGWKVKASALALAGAAMIGGVFALKGGLPGLPKEPPFIAAAHGPTKVQPPSDETVAAATEAGASLMKDSAQPAHVKVINSEEQPIDLNAQASIAGRPAPAAIVAPTAAAATQTPASATSATPVAATVNTPLVAPPAAAPPALPSQFPDPKPVRTVSLRPDGTPIATGSLPQESSAPSATAEAPMPAGKTAAKAMNETAGTAQPSSPKVELPTKLSTKSSARVVVAKTDTTAPAAAGTTPTQALQLGASAKPEKPAKPPKPAQAAPEPAAAQAAPTTPTPPAEQPDNPLARAFGQLVGAAAPPAASPPQAVDPTAATASGGWAVQLAAPKSEAEAKGDLARLNAKYSSALNGSTIGVHKAVVNGETVYRLRVVGLTKADAAALCARLKGDGGNCFIAR